MHRALAVCLALLLAPLSAAAYPKETDLIRSSNLDVSGETPPVLLNGVACNASAAARTFAVNTGQTEGYAVGAFQLNFTQNAATLLTIQAKGSLDAQSTWATIPSCDDTSDGICGLVGTSTFTRDVSAGSENFLFRVDFLGAPDVQLIVTCTGGGASDLITLKGRITAQ